MYINSVLNSFSIMRAFLGRERSMTLKSISEHARMPPSKVHRYLQSLVSCGMVSQDLSTGRYALGTMAVEYGLAGLTKIDPVRRASRAALGLAVELDVGVAVSVFSAAGPVVILYEEPPSEMRHHVAIGTMNSLISSSSGHIFLSFLSRDRVRDHLRPPAVSEALKGVDMDGLIGRVRTAGYATESASYSQPVYGVSAPVFNALGDLAAVMTFYSARSELLDRHGRALRRLLEETRRLSLSGGEILHGRAPVEPTVPRRVVNS